MIVTEGSRGPYKHACVGRRGLLAMPSEIGSAGGDPYAGFTRSARLHLGRGGRGGGTEGVVKVGG